MSDSKLCLDAIIKRSRKVFQVRIKEKGPIFSFWLEHGMIDWIQGKPTKESFRVFHSEFERLTYDVRYRTINAALEGFNLQGFNDDQLKLVVVLAQKKGWYLLSLVNRRGTVMFDMEMRFEEARNIFDTIYYYYVT